MPMNNKINCHIIQMLDKIIINLNKLIAINTYPTNRADRVLTSSNIEIEMSYSNIENFEKYVQIVPEVEGTWEQKGKVYRFIPSNGLQIN